MWNNTIAMAVYIFYIIDMAYNMANFINITRNIILFSANWISTNVLEVNIGICNCNRIIYGSNSIWCSSTLNMAYSHIMHIYVCGYGK